MVETESALSVCPGCALALPPSTTSSYDGYYHVSAECWSVYTEVLAADFSNVVLFSQAHQLTVDTYAVQHAGGGHNPKSICVHLVGLHLQIEEGLPGPMASRCIQRFASRRSTAWPRFSLPHERSSLTVGDVARASDAEEHVATVRLWAHDVWESWSHAHDDIATIVYDEGLL